VRKIAADAGAIAVGFLSRSACASVFIAEGYVLVNVVANGLDAAPTERCLPEQRPCNLGKSVGLAIAAGQEERQSVVGQILHSVLICVGSDHIRLARVIHDPIGREPGSPGRRHDPIAPITKAVAIGTDRDGWTGDEMIRHPRCVCSEHSASAAWASAAGTRRPFVAQSDLHGFYFRRVRSQIIFDCRCPPTLSGSSLT
jgi:hypothetical protein